MKVHFRRVLLKQKIAFFTTQINDSFTLYHYQLSRWTFVLDQLCSLVVKKISLTPTCKI